jgi:hypothetical protein
MVRRDRARAPTDAFNINDHVKCKNPRSKHYGHTGHVTGMGKARLFVQFDNGHIGQFIDWRDAELIERPIEAIVPTASTEAVDTDGEDIEQLTTLLEHMAFTAATVISSDHGNSHRMENLLASFDRQVRSHTNSLASTRRDNVTRNNDRASLPPSVNRVPQTSCNLSSAKRGVTGFG